MSSDLDLTLNRIPLFNASLEAMANTIFLEKKVDKFSTVRESLSRIFIISCTYIVNTKYDRKGFVNLIDEYKILQI